MRSATGVPVSAPAEVARRPLGRRTACARKEVPHRRRRWAIYACVHLRAYRARPRESLLGTTSAGPTSRILFALAPTSRALLRVGRLRAFGRGSGRRASIQHRSPSGPPARLRLPLHRPRSPAALADSSPGVTAVRSLEADCAVAHGGTIVARSRRSTRGGIRGRPTENVTDRTSSAILGGRPVERRSRRGFSTPLQLLPSVRPRADPPRRSTEG